MNIHDLFKSKNIDFVCACGMMVCAIALACITSKETESSEPQATQKYSAYSDSVKQARLNKIIATKDHTIKQLFNEVDSIAKNKDKNTTDSLNNNEDYITRNNINRQLDSLWNNNQIQLRRAQRAARKSPSYIKDIPCSEETFYTFFHVPDVKKARQRYLKNQQLIKKLKNDRRKTQTLAATERNVKHYFDSLTNVEIAQRLTQINRLLHEKDTIISKKQR